MHLEEKHSMAISEEIDRITARLMELGCDSVQVVTTHMLQGNRCGAHFRGAGNLYARFGAVQEWMDNQKNIGMAQELACSLQGDE